MDLGVGTIVYEFAGIPLIEAVDRLHNFGIKYLDILAFGDYNPAMLPVEKQLEIGKKLKDYGMRASSVVTCAPGNLASNDPKERDETIELFKYASKLVKRLGGKQILIGKGAGNVDYFLPRKEAWQNSVAAVKEFCKWAKKEDIIVTLELEPEFLHVLNGVESMKAFIGEVNEENCFANADLGHLHILRTGPEELASIKDKIFHVHISENFGLAHTNSVVGEGNLDIKWFIDAISAFGIDKTCERLGDVAVAGLEVGEPGEYISNSDFRILKSIGNTLSRVPQLRDKSL